MAEVERGAWMRPLWRGPGSFIVTLACLIGALWLAEYCVATVLDWFGCEALFPSKAGVLAIGSSLSLLALLGIAKDGVELFNELRCFVKAGRMIRVNLFGKLVILFVSVAGFILLWEKSAACSSAEDALGDSVRTEVDYF